MSKEAVVYQGFNGLKYPDGVVEGTGFIQDDIIETVVRLSEGSVEWMVNGALKARQHKKYLMDDSTKFVPYIEVYTKGDSLEWLGCIYS